MQALLLAGGFGTRLRPLTDSIPKCMVPIHGRPLLDLWLDLVFAGPFERAVVNTHYLADVVRDHVARSRWRDRIDLVHEAALLGTGGTVRANLSRLSPGSFLVAHADNLTDVDLGAFAARHEARAPGTAITMLAFHTDSPRTCGILECDAAGIVRGFHEKVADPPGNLANGAVYMFTPEVAAFIAGLDREVIDLSTEVIPHFVGRIQAIEHRGYHRDIGTPESLAVAEREFPRGHAA